MLLIVWKYNLRKPSAIEEEWRKEELERKPAKLKTLIEQARGFLAVIEAERLKPNREAADSDAAAAQDKEKNMSGVDRILLQLVGEERKDEEFKIRFIDMWETCRELQELSRNHELLPEGADLSAQILSMELSHASSKTLGHDQRYSNGERLKDRLGLALWFRHSCQPMRKHFSVEGRKVIDRHLSNLLKKWVAGWAILGKQHRWDLFYALQLVGEARKEMLILFAASCMAAVNGLFDALEVLYSTETWEVLRNPAFEWPSFGRKLLGHFSIMAVKFTLHVLTDRVDHVGRQRMEHRVRTMLYSSLLHQDFEWYRLGQTDERNMEYICGSVFGLPDSAHSFVHAFNVIIEKSTSAVGQVAIVLSKSSGLFRSMVMLKFLSFLAHTGIGWLAESCKEVLEHRTTPAKHEWYEPVMPENLPTTRAFTGEARTLRNWEMSFGAEMRKDSLREIVDIVASPFYFLSENLPTFVSSIQVAHLVKKGDLSVADSDAIWQMTDNVAQHGNELWDTWKKAKEEYSPLARSWEIISSKPTIGLSGGILPSGQAQGRLVFEDVEFKYEDGPLVLKGVSFEIEAGTTCALTGTSGSGKTTVFNLFQRFHDIRKGRILLDGVDIREYNPIWLRQQMSIVHQRPRIFSISLLDNLVYGCKKEPPIEQIEDACRAAGLYEVIFDDDDKFPAGLHTRVSGHTLSGGELQRVAIARALLKDAPILLLDEATSSLDSHTQTAVKGAIANLMKGRTTVMIAHRLETIKEADQILVVRKGKIVERGNHAELVTAGGPYAELYQQQVTETMVGEHQQPVSDSVLDQGSSEGESGQAEPDTSGEGSSSDVSG